MTLEDALNQGGRALREQAAASVDLDKAMAETLNRSIESDLGEQRPSRRHPVLLVAACVALLAASAGGLWYATSDSTSERIGPADLVAPDSTDPEAPSTVAQDVAIRGVDEFGESFSATSVFSVLPAAVTRMDEAVSESIVRLAVQAADLKAIEEFTGNLRPSAGAEADEWLNTTFGLDAAVTPLAGMALNPPSFPALGSATSEERRDELGFDTIDVDMYATADASIGGFFGVYQGDQVELSDQFVELGNGVLTLGEGEDQSRNVDEISPVRPMGVPVRAIAEAGLTAISPTTADVVAWRDGSDRLIDDDRMLAAAQALDRTEIVDLSAFAMDFTARDVFEGAQPAITEPFSVVAVGTSISDGVPTTVLTYVFDNPTAATSMRATIDSIWHQPLALSGETPADFYTSIDVSAAGRAVIVTAPLEPTTHTSKWLEYLARGEAIFTHTSTENTESLEADQDDASCPEPDGCIRYSIKPGDFPVRIAEAFCITIGELEAANGWNDVNRDFPGVGITVVIPSFGPRSPCPEPTDELLSVDPTVDTRPPAANDEFITASGDGSATIDVWNAVELVSSYDLTCPANRSCTVQSTRPIGDTIWVAITETEPGDERTIVGTRVVSVSSIDGEIVEHLALGGTAEVRSAGLGIDGVLYAHVEESVGYKRTLVAIEAGQATLRETNVSGFRLSDDGRFLAVSFSDPLTGETARFEVSNLADQSSIEFGMPFVNAGPVAWSPDNRSLIVDAQWETGTAWVINPWSGSGNPVFGDPLSEADLMRDGACFMSDRVVAHRTWNVGYGQGDAQPGTIRLTSLDTGATVAELGENLFGDAFRCHADGSITYLRRPVAEVEISPDVFQLEPAYDAPVELVHIASDGTTSVRAAGDLRFV